MIALPRSTTSIIIRYHDSVIDAQINYQRQKTNPETKKISETIVARLNLVLGSAGLGRLPTTLY